MQLKMRLIVLLSIITVVFGSSVSLIRQKRMLVGTDATTNEFPYQVSIQYMGHVCSGVIITQDWVLTTASCVAGLFEPLITIRYGSITHSRGGNVVRIIRMVVHPSYDRRTSSNDIAVVRVATVFPSTIKPASLARRTTDPILFEGTKLTVSGWGLQWHGNGELTDSLKKSTLDYIPLSLCVASYKESNIALQSNSNHLCAGKLNHNGGPSICQGDVGGPLYLPGLNRVYGIAKFALGCGGRPSVFTEVSAYRGWIQVETGLSQTI